MDIGVVTSVIGHELIATTSADYRLRITGGAPPASLTDASIAQRDLGANVSFQRHRHARGRIVDVIGSVAEPRIVVALQKTKKKNPPADALVGDSLTFA